MHCGTAVLSVIPQDSQRPEERKTMRLALVCVGCALVGAGLAVVWAVLALVCVALALLNAGFVLVCTGLALALMLSCARLGLASGWSCGIC
jgi:predicted acyltransferase